MYMKQWWLPFHRFVVYWIKNHKISKEMSRQNSAGWPEHPWSKTYITMLRFPQINNHLFFFCDEKYSFVVFVCFVKEANVPLL